MIRFRIFGVRIKVSIWFTALITLLFLFGTRYTAVCLWLAAAHEIGHILPYALFGGRISEICLFLGRAEIKRRRDTETPAGELASLFGGCAMNVLLALIFAVFAQLELFALSAAFAALNLIPAKGLDGGEIAKYVVAARYGENAAARAMKISGAVIGVGFSALGMYFALYYHNPTILIFGAFIFINSFINN